MQVICTLLWIDTGNHASTSPLSFYRPDAFSATQPTASMQSKGINVTIVHTFIVSGILYLLIFLLFFNTVGLLVLKICFNEVLSHMSQSVGGS